MGNFVELAGSCPKVDTPRKEINTVHPTIFNNTMQSYVPFKEKKNCNSSSYIFNSRDSSMSGITAMPVQLSAYMSFDLVFE